MRPPFESLEASSRQVCIARIRQTVASLEWLSATGAEKSGAVFPYQPLESVGFRNEEALNARAAAVEPSGGQKPERDAEHVPEQIHRVVAK